MHDAPRIPVTVLSGYLGAGKTTVVKHLLAHAGARRLVVVENEFADVGIDAELLDLPAERRFELNDGCVCCTVLPELVEVLRQLPAAAVDHVLIETTGLADPTPVLRALVSPPLDARFRLAGLVTVVDAEHVLEELGRSPLCGDQLAPADVVVVNKVDRVDVRRREEVVAVVGARCPGAQICAVSHGRADPEVLLDAIRAPDQPVADAPHRHDDGIRSVTVDEAGHIDVDRLETWLTSLSHDPQLELLRTKGVISVAGHGRGYVLQGVRDRFDVWPERPWGDRRRSCRAVFIGRGLDAAAVTAGFRSCMDRPPAEAPCSTG